MKRKVVARLTYSDQIDASLCSSLEERLPSKDSLGTKVTLLALNKSPINVEGDAVVSQCLDLLEDI